MDPSRMQPTLWPPDEHGVKAFGIARVNDEPADLDGAGTDRGGARLPRPLGPARLGRHCDRHRAGQRIRVDLQTHHAKGIAMFWLGFTIGLFTGIIAMALIVLAILATPMGPRF